MNKHTAFYVAGAALAGTLFFANTHEAAANTLPLADNSPTASQATFDFATAGATRTINFSLPVDPTTIEGNITLIKTSTNEKITANIFVDPANSKAVKVEAPHEEGEQYQLAISKEVKSYGQLVLNLQAPFTYYYTAKNVDAAQPVKGAITAITDNSVTIDGKAYTVNSSVAKAFANNKAALAGANVTVTVKENEIQSIEEIELTASGTKEAPMTFNGRDASLKNTTITVAADHVTIERAAIKNLFVAGNVTTNVHVNNSSISGEAHILEAERDVKAEAEIIHSTAITIIFNDSTVVEMTISRINVYSEISGTSRVQLLTIRADASIHADKDIVLPKLTIEKGVTNIALNASIASVVIKTDNNIKVTGSGDFNKVNIETTKNVEFATTGTVKEMTVPNKDTSVTLGDDVKIGHVEPPTDAQVGDVITNYDDVKDNVNVEITDADKGDYLAAKLIADENTYGLATISLTNDTTKSVYYDIYSSYWHPPLLAVGDKLTGAEKKWQKDAPIPLYLDAEYYIYAVDEQNVVTEVFEVQRTMIDRLDVSVKDNTLTVQIPMLTEGQTLSTLFDGFYISNGTKGKLFTEAELATYDIQYTDKGVAYVTMPAPAGMTFTDGEVYYSLNELGGNGTRYIDVSNIRVFGKNPSLPSIPGIDESTTNEGPDVAVYTQALYDYANAPTSTQVIQYFNDLLTRTNYDIVESALANGQTYRQQVSRIATLPSVASRYIEAFKETRFETIADVQKTVEEINEANKSILSKHVQFTKSIINLYEENTNAPGQPLRDDVTEAMVDTIERDIYFDTALQTDDKQDLYSKLSTIRSALNGNNSTWQNSQYSSYVNDLLQNGNLKPDVTDAMIDSAIAKATAEIPADFMNKTTIINRLENLKTDFYIKPLDALLNERWSDDSARLKRSVTKQQLTDAIAKVRQSIEGKDEQLTRTIESDIAHFEYYYIAREANALFKRYSFSNYYATHLKDNVTIEQINALFEGIDVSKNYAIENLYNNLKLSLALKPALQYVIPNYYNLNNIYMFTPEMTLEKLEALHNELTKTYENDEELLRSINSWFAEIYDYYFKMQVSDLYTVDLTHMSLSNGLPLKTGVTDAQVTAAIANLQKYDTTAASEVINGLQRSIDFKNAWSLYAPLSFNKSFYKVFEQGVTTQQVIDTLSPLQNTGTSEAMGMINKVVLDFAREKLSLIYNNRSFLNSFQPITANNVNAVLTADEQKQIATELLHMIDVLKPTNQYDLQRLTPVLETLINGEPARDVQSMDAPFWTTLPSYGAVAPFLFENEYGVTFAEGVSIEALEDFAQDVHTANADEAAKELLLATIDDAMARAQQQAFTSVTVE